MLLPLLKNSKSSSYECEYAMKVKISIQHLNGIHLLIDIIIIAILQTASHDYEFVIIYDLSMTA